MLCHLEVTFIQLLNLLKGTMSIYIICLLSLSSHKFTHKFYYYVLIFIELYFSNFRLLTCFIVTIPDAV